MKINETLWFTGMYGHVGIVLGTDAITGERKAYIGVHAGQEEGADTHLIAAGGTKLEPAIARRVADWLEGK